MIECQVIQGCEVGITVRHNNNVVDLAHHNDSHSMNANVITQPLPIPSLIPFNRLRCSVMRLQFFIVSIPSTLSNIISLNLSSPQHCSIISAPLRPGSCDYSHELNLT